MNREEIKGILPHREPMLLVDEVEKGEDGAAHGIYRVRGDEWFLQGHFPGNPVVPGVVLCEIIGQASCVLLSSDMENVTPYYTGMDKVRFKHPVYPGDTLEITATIDKQKPPFYFIKGTAKVDGKLCVSGEFSFALMKNQD